MDNQIETLNKSIKIVKEETTNEVIRDMIKLLEEDTPSNDKEQIIDNEKLKVLSHLTYKDYAKKEKGINK